MEHKGGYRVKQGHRAKRNHRVNQEPRLEQEKTRTGDDANEDELRFLPKKKKGGGRGRKHRQAGVQSEDPIRGPKDHSGGDKEGAPKHKQRVAKRSSRRRRGHDHTERSLNTS